MTERCEHCAQLEHMRREIERLNFRKRGPRWTAHLNSIALPYQPAWREWLARYGLPTMEEIPVHSELVFDADTKTLTALRKVRDDNGKTIYADDYAVTEKVTVVVDGILQDFPSGVEVTVD